MTGMRQRLMASINPVAMRATPPSRRCRRHPFQGHDGHRSGVLGDHGVLGRYDSMITPPRNWVARPRFTRPVTRPRASRHQPSHLPGALASLSVMSDLLAGRSPWIDNATAPVRQSSRRASILSFKPVTGPGRTRVGNHNGALAGRHRHPCALRLELLQGPDKAGR